MTLDYLHKVNGYGDCIVRLFDFGSMEAGKFRQTLEQTLIQNKKSLDLAAVDSIKAVNCNLIFRISKEDTGITSTDNKVFFCDLTIGAYSQMITLLEPFCSKESRGRQWLYDVDSQVDLLFSPTGTW